MVTTAQIDRLGRRIEQLAAAIVPDERVRVAVFRGESPEFALQRHRELRPDHAGKLVRFEHRSEDRTELGEMFAAMTSAELQAIIARIDAEGRGVPVGVRMLRDAHGWAPGWDAGPPETPPAL